MSVEVLVQVWVCVHYVCLCVCVCEWVFFVCMHICIRS